MYYYVLLYPYGPEYIFGGGAILDTTTYVVCSALEEEQMCHCRRANLSRQKKSDLSRLKQVPIMYAELGAIQHVGCRTWDVMGKQQQDPTPTD